MNGVTRTAVGLAVGVGQLRTPQRLVEGGEADAVGLPLPFLYSRNGLERAIGGQHQGLRFGVALPGQQCGAKEALRLGDAPVSRGVEMSAHGQDMTERRLRRGAVTAEN